MADNEQLKHIRSQIVDGLSSISAEMKDNDVVSFDTLLVVAHNTGNTELLQTALSRIGSMGDAQAKADAYLDVLDEVDYLASRPQPEHHEHHEEHHEQ